MAEANATNANGQGTVQPDQGQAGTNQNGNGQAAAAEPAWFSHVPEAQREEARKGWMMEKDYRQKTEGLTAKEKAWEAEKAKLVEDNQKYQVWWSGFEPTFQQIAEPNNWKQIQEILAGKRGPQQQAAMQQQVAANDDLWRDYDLLPPQEQAKRQAQYLQTQHQQEMAQLRQEMAQQIQQEKAQAQNYMAIMTDAFSRKANDPTLDVPAFIQKQLEFSMGKFNPGELAYKSLTSERDLKKAQDEWMKKGREEAALEFKNQQQSNGAGINPSFASFKQAPRTRDQIEEAVRNDATKLGIPWHRDG